MGIESATSNKSYEQLTFDAVLFQPVKVQARGDGSYVVTPGKLETWVRTRQAAQAIGVNVRTVQRYIEEGRLPARRVGPKILQVRSEDLAVLVRDYADSFSSPLKN